MKKTLKKIIAGISVVSMCLAAAPLNISAVTTYYRGDINGNGTVDIQDVAAMSKYLHGIKSANC